jgi:hypothetical protein
MANYACPFYFALTAIDFWPPACYRFFAASKPKPRHARLANNLSRVADVIHISPAFL